MENFLLKCINLLEKPDGGAIEIDDINLDYGQPISAKTAIALRKQIGMVFQQFNLWLHLTVLQNLILAPIAVLKKKKTEVVPQAEMLLAKIGMLDKAYCYPLQLSGGQQQRVAIASIPKTEIDAGRALGLSAWDRLCKIMAPRALRIVLPAYSNEAVIILKSTALASTITLLDFMGVINKLIAQTYATILFLVLAGSVYLVLNLLIITSFHWLEKKLKIAEV